MKKKYQQPQSVIYDICAKGTIAITNTSNNAGLNYGGGGDEDVCVKEDRGFDIWGEDNE